MAIDIYASDRTTLKYTLNAIQMSTLHQSLNGECTFDFTMPGRYIPSIAVGDEVRLGDFYFDVVRVAKATNQGAGVAVTVSCEHISYRLADVLQVAAHFSGTPSTVLATILAGTGFSVGTVTVTGTWSITINEDTNKRDALQQWALACGAELTYTGRNINFLAHAGSATTVMLSDKENVKALSVTLEARSDTQTYTVELSRLQHLALGDAVRIKYTSLNLDVTTRVLTLDYDPFHPMAISMTTGDYIPNFTNAVSAALEARIKEGAPYYGVTIDRENGITIRRSDEASEAVFNSDLFTMRAKVDGTMKDRIYFDPVKGDYIFDGVLGADAVFTDSLYAEMGDVSELTVDRVSTSKRVLLWGKQDSSDDNYLQIQDHEIQFISGHVEDPSQKVQATNRDGTSLYWQEIPHSYDSDGYPQDEDGKRIYATTENMGQGHEIWTYVYTDTVKASWSFDMGSQYYEPKIVLGAGTGTSGDERLKGVLYKSADAFEISFEDRNNNALGLTMNNSGYLDLHGLRKPTRLDFSNWSNGSFTETVDGGSVNQYTVTFDGSGMPVTITDGDGHATVVVW